MREASLKLSPPIDGVSGRNLNFFEQLSRPGPDSYMHTGKHGRLDWLKMSLWLSLA
jgi:hypothetical protein